MEIVCVDTNILIEYYRHKDKSQTRLYQLSHNYEVAVPVLVEYEILRGEKSSSDSFWVQFFDSVTILPFDRACAREAADIYTHLRQSNLHQQPLDILIAATARAWNYPVATLNTKDFNQIPGVRIV
jgi:predicted nucleic acid-binding protein